MGTVAFFVAVLGKMRGGAEILMTIGLFPIFVILSIAKDLYTSTSALQILHFVQNDKKCQEVYHYQNNFVNFAPH